MKTEKARSIKRIIPAHKISMDGHSIDQPLPAQGIDQIDPFLLIHHWNNPMKGGFKQKEVGVGPHPHRGFSPVTFVYKGNIQHRDSLGNNATVFEGGTQWMHAGRGITHSERPTAELAEKGGELEFIQFWVNTPAKYKMETPYYLPLSKESTPALKQNGSEIAVVAGEYGGLIGPAKTLTPQILLRVECEPDSEVSLSLPKNHNTIIYQLNGKSFIDNKSIGDKTLVWFNSEEGSIEIKVQEATRFIVLSGKPIDEEVSTYGPFVMNTQTQIMEALRDAQIGKMGVLIEDFD